MYKLLLTEFVSTLFFIFIILSTSNFLAIGASLALVVFLFNVYVNPAVSIAFYVLGKLTPPELFGVVISQILGGYGAIKLYETMK
jgi:glycerol uptake facilitator-like aquaporin